MSYHDKSKKKTTTQIETQTRGRASQTQTQIQGLSGGGGNPIILVNQIAQQDQGWTYELSGEEYVGLYHQHQDGTVMTEHTMGANDNSVVVTTVPPNGSRNRTNGMRQTSGRRTRQRRTTNTTRTQRNNMNRRTTNQTTRTATSTQPTRRRTMTTRGNGSGRTGGDSGGY